MSQRTLEDKLQEILIGSQTGSDGEYQEEPCDHESGSGMGYTCGKECPKWIKVWRENPRKSSFKRLYDKISSGIQGTMRCCDKNYTTSDNYCTKCRNRLIPTTWEHQNCPNWEYDLSYCRDCGDVSSNQWPLHKTVNNTSCNSYNLKNLGVHQREEIERARSGVKECCDRTYEKDDRYCSNCSNVLKPSKWRHEYCVDWNPEMKYCGNCGKASQQIT